MNLNELNYKLGAGVRTIRNIDPKKIRYSTLIEIKKLLINNGFKYDSGTRAVVFFHEDRPDKAYKIFVDDNAYASYAAYARLHPEISYFPKVSKIFNINDKIKFVIIERLIDPKGKAEYASHRRIFNQALDYVFLGSDATDEERREAIDKFENKEVLLLVNFLEDLISRWPLAVIDFYDNWMVRKNGDIVITDPFT